MEPNQITAVTDGHTLQNFSCQTPWERMKNAFIQTETLELHGYTTMHICLPVLLERKLQWEYYWLIMQFRCKTTLIANITHDNSTSHMCPVAIEMQINESKV